MPVPAPVPVPAPMPVPAPVPVPSPADNGGSNDAASSPADNSGSSGAAPSPGENDASNNGASSPADNGGSNDAASSPPGNGGSNGAAPADGGDNAGSSNDGLNDGALVRPTEAPHLTDPSQVIIGVTPNSLASGCQALSLIIYIVSNIGFPIGVLIVIDYGTDIEEWNTIVGYGSLVLATPLKYDHGPGALINLATEVTSGASASLDAAGFSAVSSLCCPSEMETFFTRLLESLGYFVCSKPHLQGLMHWFHCVPNMDFQYVLDVIHNGNPCMYWAKTGETCPVLQRNVQASGADRGENS